MRILAVVACAAFAASAASPHEHGHYAGQQDRDIKSLSADEVNGYLAGAGMGFAKPAELNGYPGPMHSLENAAALGLTASQREALEGLMRRHKEEARRLGADVVRLERELDALFAHGHATPSLVDAKLREIALVQASLRGSHLKTHLAATSLLSPEQVERYNRARGYK